MNKNIQEAKKESLNIASNILLRRKMLLIGMMFIFVINLAFFFISYIVRGNEMIYLIVDASILAAMGIYLIVYATVGRKDMYKSFYVLGRMIYLLPVLFYLFLSVFYAIKYRLINYEYIAYAVLSIALEILVFRINIKDKDSTKRSYRSVIAGVIGILLVPVFLIIGISLKLEISVSKTERNIKYALNDDGTMRVEGVYFGISESVKIPDTYYEKKVTSIGENAFKDKKNIKEITVPANITEINAYAFSGIDSVYIEGAPTLRTNSLSGVKNVYLLNADEKVTLNNNVCDKGTNIISDRKLVDYYRQNEFLKNYDVKPSVEDDEVYINFNTAGNSYVKTIILKKNSTLTKDSLKNTDDIDMYYYTYTNEYSQANDYYLSKYLSGEKVLPYWFDNSGNVIEWDKAVSDSITITPQLEEVREVIVDYLLGESKVEKYYFSKSKEITLPVLEEKPREGFDDLKYVYNEQPIAVINDNVLDKGIISAVWSLKKPVITDVSNTEDDALSRVYSLSNVTNLAATCVHDIDVTYTYKWVKDGVTRSTSNNIDVTNVIDSGKYNIIVEASFTEYGKTYTSEAIKNIEVDIRRATPVIEANSVDSIYNGISQGIEGATVTTGETQEISYMYSGTTFGGVSYSSEVPPVEAGNYTVILSVPQTANYVSVFISKTVRIAKRSVNVTFYENMTSDYNGSTQSFDERYLNNEFEEIEASSGNRGLISGDNLGLVLKGLELENGRYNAGEYILDLTYDNPNYTVTKTNPNAKYTINKVSATVSLSGKTITYGDAMPELSSTDTLKAIDKTEYSLLIYNDSSLEDLATINPTLGYYDAKTYYIGVKANDTITRNYNLSFDAKELVINKKTLTVTLSENELTYNGAEQEKNVVVKGLVSTHSSADAITITGNVKKNAGDYEVTVQLNSGYANNYEISSFDNAYSIKKANLSVTFIGGTITYGEEVDYASLVSYVGFVGTDSASSLSGTIDFENKYNKYDQAKSYQITPTGLSSTNYNITYQQGVLVVQKAVIDVTIEANNYMYGTTPTFTLSYSGILSVDSDEVVEGTPVYKILTKDTGVLVEGNLTVGFYVVEVSGLSATNYTFTYNSSEFEVVKANLTIAFSNSTMTYGDSFVVLNNVVATGLKYEDTINSIGGTHSYSILDSSETLPQIKPGTYTIALSGYEANNYSITLQSGTLTVNKANVDVTCNDITVDSVDDINFTSTITGLVYDDELTVQYKVFDGENEVQLEDLTSGTYRIVAVCANNDYYIISTNDGTLIIN